MTVLEEESL